MNHSMAIRTDESKVIKFRLVSGIEFADRQSVVALDESVSPVSIRLCEVEPAHLAKKIPGFPQHTRLFLLDYFLASLPVAMNPREDPPFGGFGNFVPGTFQ